MLKKKLLLFCAVLGLAIVFWSSYYGIPNVFSSVYTTTSSSSEKVLKSDEFNKAQNQTPVHLKQPEILKAVYFSSWAAGTPSFRDRLNDLIDTTEINSVVIDVKDYSGKLAFEPNDSELKSLNSFENRIRDIDDFIAELHKKNVYVIGRVAVFQDPFYVSIHPELAVQSITNQKPWHDKKGLSWIDVGAKPYWSYIEKVANESYNRGFDEINFDYIRFPSDGIMSDTNYTQSVGKTKSVVLEEFFSFLHNQLSAKNIPISADLFGLTTTSFDDLGIGQVLEKALPYFDYVYPMVYPSHFANGFDGFANPAAHPYEVIYKSMGNAITRMASTTEPVSKLKPWLQDFDLGADYGATEVRAEIKATDDLGLNGWLLWDPSNKYTKEALLPKQ